MKYYDLKDYLIKIMKLEITRYRYKHTNKQVKNIENQIQKIKKLK